MLTLGIESSCDETGIALYDNNKGLLAHALYSQSDLHDKYGGVVPELASRDHIRKILPLINDVLNTADCTRLKIDNIAYTAGPGLTGALLVGATIGRSLAWAWGIPVLPINHMEGHLLSPLLENNSPSFPFVSLLVSGGHTLLVDVKHIGQYTILGESVDDAVGEAFDKTAKMLGLTYPGGPALEALAKKGIADKYRFPRPMTNRPGLDFSFSGLKTFAVNTWRNSKQSAQDKADIAHAFQAAAIETLVIKCQRALQKTNHSTLIVAGGVSANNALRTRFNAIADICIYYPRPAFCSDNGAMIAFAGSLRHCATGNNTQSDFIVRSRWSLDELTPPN